MKPKGLVDVKSEGKQKRRKDAWSSCSRSCLDGGVVYLGKTRGVRGPEEQDLGAESSLWAMSCV